MTEATSLRYDKHGAIKFMATADNWVMCKRPYCAPFVLKKSDWLGLSEKPLGNAEDTVVTGPSSPAAEEKL